MALFQVNIQKRVGSEYWTNVYWVDADAVGTAAGYAADIVDAEREMHGSGVAFDKLLVRDPANPGDFISTALTGNGTRTLEGTMLPLFNSLNIDFTPAVGRTTKKYLRGCLGEGDIDFDELTGSGLTTNINTYIAAILAVPHICDESLNTLVTGFFKTKVGMRQLRRGSKRRAAPVI